MSTTTITISTQTGLGERMLGGVARFLKSCLAAYLDWRQARLDTARLQSMSECGLRDIGMERDSYELALRRARRDEPWSRVDII